MHCSTSSGIEHSSGEFWSLAGFYSLFQDPSKFIWSECHRQGLTTPSEMCVPLGGGPSKATPKSQRGYETKERGRRPVWIQQRVIQRILGKLALCCLRIHRSLCCFVFRGFNLQQQGGSIVVQDYHSVFSADIQVLSLEIEQGVCPRKQC